MTKRKIFGIVLMAFGVITFIILLNDNAERTIAQNIIVSAVTFIPGVLLMVLPSKKAKQMQPAPQYQAAAPQSYRFTALPIDTTGYQRRDEPTEKQLNYARDLGLIIPPDANIDDVSTMITRVRDGDLDTPPIGLVQYLQTLGAQPSPYIGKMATIEAIRSRMQGAGLAAFYAYAVHCSMQGATLGNLSTAPQLSAYYTFGNEQADNERFQKSLADRPNSDFYSPNRSTTAYIIAQEYLRKLQ